MSIQSFLLLLVLILIPLGCWALIPVIRRYRQTAGAVSLAALLFAIGWWGVLYAAELAVGDNLNLKIVFSAVKYVGIVFIPVFWLTFAIEYTKTIQISDRNRRALLIVPLLSLVILVTNSWHGLFRSNLRLVAESPLLITFAADFRPWFWVHTAYSYILLVAGAIILLRGLPNLPLLYRRQRVVILIAIIIPFVGNSASLLSLTPIPNFDLTPLAFSVTAAMLTWGFTRLKLLDLSRVARQQIINQSSIGIIVLDKGQRVIDVNRSAMAIFHVDSNRLVGEVFRDKFSALADHLPDLDSLQTSYETELTLPVAADVQHYLVQVDVLESATDQFGGHIITLLDITSRKAIERTLRHKESEARKLAHVASRTTNMVVIADANGLIEWVNDSFVLITGYTLEEVRGAKPGDFLHGVDTDQETVQYMRDCLAKGEAFSCEVLNYNKQGDPFWVEVEAQPAYDDAGILTNFIAIETDITERKRMEENLRQREAEARYSAYKQKIVYELLRIISTELDTKMVLARAVQTIVEQTGWETAAIFLPTSSSASLKLAAAYSATDSSESSQHLPHTHLYGLATQAYQTEDMVQRPEEAPDTHLADISASVTGRLAVPLNLGNKTTGVLTVENQNGRPFTADDVSLTEAFTDTLVVGLNNARLYEDLDNYLLELSMMHSISQTATESLDMEEVLRETLMVTISSSEFEGGAVFLVDEESKRLTVAATQDSSNELQQLFENPTFIDTLKQHLAHGAVSKWSSAEETHLNGEAQHALHPYWRQAQLALCLTMPLMQQKALLGGMVLFCTKKPKSDISISMFITAAPHIATAIASTRFHQEITQKHSQLNTLIEASQDGIVLIDTHNVIQILNEAAHELLHLSDRPQDWAQRPVYELLELLLVIDPTTFEAFLEDTRQLLTPDQRLRQGETEFAGQFIRWTEVLVIEGAGKMLGRLFVLHDVTEEKQLLQMRDDLTNTIVHDMRNPLMGIKAAIEMLEYQLVDASNDQKALLRLAQESSDNLVSLVSGLLDISRLESGRMPLNKQLTSIYDIAEQIINLEKPLATQKGITLALDVSLDLPPAYADRNLIMRVFQNLVGNAIKFTPENGRVTIGAVVQSDNSLCISVRDTGYGIPANLQETLFQKFTTGQHESKGSGLGLAFCHLVVEAHGGEIWVESEPGRGSSFKFTLPPEPELMETSV